MVTKTALDVRKVLLHNSHGKLTLYKLLLMDGDGDGTVSKLEFYKAMLLSMKQVTGRFGLPH